MFHVSRADCAALLPTAWIGEFRGGCPANASPMPRQCSFKAIPNLRSAKLFRKLSLAQKTTRKTSRRQTEPDGLIAFLMHINFLTCTLTNVSFLAGLICLLQTGCPNTVFDPKVDCSCAYPSFLRCPVAVLCSGCSVYDRLVQNDSKNIHNILRLCQARGKS